MADKFDQEDPFKKYGGNQIDQEDPFKKYGGVSIEEPSKKKTESGLGGKVGSSVGRLDVGAGVTEIDDKGKPVGGALGGGLGTGLNKKPSIYIPETNIEEYNASMKSKLGLPKLNLGSDLPQIKREREAKEYQELRNIEETEIKPFEASVFTGTVQPSQIKNLANKPYGKKLVNDVLRQYAPEAGGLSLDENVFGSDKNAEQVANVLQQKFRQQGIEAQNQYLYNLDKEVYDNLNGLKRTDVNVSGGTGGAATGVSEANFPSIDTNSPVELGKALEFLSGGDGTYFELNGKRLTQEEISGLSRKINEKLFAIKAGEPIHPEILSQELSGKLLNAVSNVDAEWKKNIGYSPEQKQQFIQKDFQYAEEGLNFLRDANRSAYNNIVGGILKKEKIADTDYEQLVSIGKRLESEKKFRNGDFLVDDNRDFRTYQTLKAEEAGALSEKIKQMGYKNKAKVADNVIVKAAIELGIDPNSQRVLDIRRDEASGGYGIVKGGGLTAFMRGLAQPVKSIQSTFQAIFNDPTTTYLNSRRYDYGDQIVPDKEGNYTNVLPSERGYKDIGNIFNKILEGTGQLTTQVLTSRLGGQLISAPYRAATLSVPRAALTGSQATNIAAYGGGGLSTLAQTYGSSYIDFLNKTGNPNKASFMALVDATAQSVIEVGVLPDVKLAESMKDIWQNAKRNLATDIMKVVEKGGGKEAAQPFIKKFAQKSAEIWGKEVIGEEGLQNLTNYLTEAFFSPKTAQSRNLSKETVNVIKDASLSMAVPVIVGGFAAGKSNRKLTQDALNTAAQNFDTFADAIENGRSMGVIAPQDADTALEIIKVHQQSLDKAPKQDANGEAINAARQIEYAFQNTVEEVAKAKLAKETDEVQQEPLKKQIEEAKEIKRKIFNGTEISTLPKEEKVEQPAAETQQTNNDIEAKIADIERGRQEEENIEEEDELTPIETTPQTAIEPILEQEEENEEVSTEEEKSAKNELKETINQGQELNNLKIVEDKAENEGKAEMPTTESVTQRLGINHPFYKKVSDALEKLGLIKKYNPETKEGDVIGGYVQSDSKGGFASGDMYFKADGSISYIKDGVIVEFDKNGNVISENTKQAAAEKVKSDIDGRKSAIKLLEETRDSEDFKYKTVTEFDAIGNRKKVRRLKTAEELKESTDKINAQIDKAKSELSEIEKKQPTQPQVSTVREEGDVSHAGNIKTKFRNQFKAKGVSDEHIDGAIALMDARAKSWASEEQGRTPEQWFERIADVKSGEFESSVNDILYQDKEGKKSKVIRLYHSTTTPISGDFRVKGKNNSHGIFFAAKKDYSKVFGDITYKVKIEPKNTLVLNDNEVAKTPFFNIKENELRDYLDKGYDSIAWYKGGKLQEFIVLDNSIIKDKDIVYQKNKGEAKGAVETLADGRKIIHALESPDFSTMVHEIAHVFEGDLTATEQKIVKDFGGSEPFARGFERYLREGKAPTAELKTLFDKFKQWLTDIYKTLKGSPIEKRFSSDVRNIFNRLLTEKTQEPTPQPTKAKELADKGIGKYEKKAREIADKIQKSELPDWLKADLPDGTKKAGSGYDQLKKALADAVIEMGRLLDKGVEYSQAIKQAVKDLVSLQGEENRDTIEKGFEKYYTDQTQQQPPTPTPPKQEPKEVGGGKSGNKALATRLVNSKNIPEAAKNKILESKDGLKYPVASQKEARELAKGIISELGVDEAVKLAEGRTFYRGVNSAIFAEALDGLYVQETQSSGEKALDIANEWADIANRYDEWLRAMGTEIAMVYDFYRKSPLGVKLAEKMKRDSAFKEWFNKRKESLKEVFDELMKEQEFSDIIKEKVKEELRKERLASRANRIEKVREVFKKAKESVRSNNTYAIIIPPHILETAIEAMELLYEAGEATLEVINQGINHISEKLGHGNWDKEKFRKEWEGKLKDGVSYEEKYQNRLIKEIKELDEQIESLTRKEKEKKDKTEYSEETKKLIDERDKKKKLLDELVPKKKPLTEEELSSRFLDKFRNKLNGLDENQKKEVVIRAFKKITEKGALRFSDFRKIIQDVLGLGELTENEAKKMESYVADMNDVDVKENAVFDAKTDKDKIKALKDYREAQQKAEKSATALAGILYNKPDVVNRLAGIMQLKTLTLTSLIKNPAYNIAFQATQRALVGTTLSVLDNVVFGVSKLFNKTLGTSVIYPDFNNIRNQGYWWDKFWYGTKISLKQIVTGTTNKDYFQKEIYTQQIKPAKSWRDLLSQKEWGRNFLKKITGKEYQKTYLSSGQVIDKLMQGTIGVEAEIVARLLNVGDKPFRFGAEAIIAATEADRLGYKGIDKELFIAFPKRMAYEYYKNKGVPEEKAAEKAEVTERRIIRDGEEAVFQGENMVNELMTLFGNGVDTVFGADDPISKSVKGMSTIVGRAAMPFRKVPLNVAWNLINIVVPEIALAQGILFSTKAAVAKSKGLESSRLDYLSAKKWFATALVGIAIQAATQWIASIGASTGGDDEERYDKKKERDAKKLYTRPNSINVTKIARVMNGGTTETLDGDLIIDKSWFGSIGVISNIQQNIRENMTEEERKAIGLFFDTAFMERLDRAAHEAIENGVFSNMIPMLMAYKDRNTGFANNLGINMFNTVTNIFQSGTFAQWSRAEIPYEYRITGDSFYETLNNNLAARSGLYRKFTGKYPPAQISMWGDKIEKDTPVFIQMMGMKRTDKDNFAQPLWDMYEKSQNLDLFPPDVKKTFSVDGESLKLKPSQLSKLEEFVGKSRKTAISAFLNDPNSKIWVATERGLEQKGFADLKKDEDVLTNYLQKLYKKAYTEGKIKFLEEIVGMGKQSEYSFDLQKELQKTADELNNLQQ